MLWHFSQENWEHRVKPVPNPCHWCCPDTESTIFTQAFCKLPSLPETLQADLLCADTDQWLNIPAKLYTLHGPVWHVSHSGSKVTSIFSHPGSLKYGPWWKEVLSAQVNKIPLHDIAWPALNSSHSPVKCITHSLSLSQTLKDAHWHKKQEQENPETLLLIKCCIYSGMRMHSNP